MIFYPAKNNSLYFNNLDLVWYKKCEGRACHSSSNSNHSQKGEIKMAESKAKSKAEQAELELENQDNEKSAVQQMGSKVADITWGTPLRKGLTILATLGAAFAVSEATNTTNFLSRNKDDMVMANSRRTSGIRRR